MHGRVWILGFLLLTGCGDLPVQIALAEPAPPLASSFEPATSGTIRGQVTWEGDEPVGVTTTVKAIAYNPYLHKNPIEFVTPHLPRVNKSNRGIGGAVVYLRGIDPALARPWDPAPVRIEFRDRRLVIEQGGEIVSVGFVRRGGGVTAVNRSAEFHALRGRGAAFFTLPLLIPERPAEVVLAGAGVVELFDAGGYYWEHGHLFVIDHPYFARTDSEGRFEFTQVPPGEYEIVCWMPNWNVSSRDPDPNTALIVRQQWRPAVEKRQSVGVSRAATREVMFTWRLAAFAE